jgi:GNAT superfamily N-acetyltransferase
LAPDVLSIKQEDPAQSDVAELLRHGEAFSASLYPPESNHHLPLDALRRPEARFFVARDTKGTALATGALVLHDDWAEIKRMWVEEAARGRGIARRILNVLSKRPARASKYFAWRREWLVTLHWLCMKRLASNAGRPLPTIAPTLSASSWKDLSIFCKHKKKRR